VGLLSDFNAKEEAVKNERNKKVNNFVWPWQQNNTKMDEARNPMRKDSTEG
jgi:hypothetical protein